MMTTPHADRDHSEQPCTCPRTDGYRIKRRGCPRHTGEAFPSPVAPAADQGDPMRESGTSRGPAARESDDECCSHTQPCDCPCKACRSGAHDRVARYGRTMFAPANEIEAAVERDIAERRLLRFAEAVATVTPCSCSAQRDRAEKAEAERDAALAKVARVEAFADAMVRLGSKTVPVDGLRRNLRSPITVEISPNALTEPADSKGGA